MSHGAGNFDFAEVFGDKRIKACNLHGDVRRSRLVRRMMALVCDAAFKRCPVTLDAPVCKHDQGIDRVLQFRHYTVRKVDGAAERTSRVRLQARLHWMY